MELNSQLHSYSSPYRCSNFQVKLNYLSHFLVPHVTRSLIDEPMDSLEGMTPVDISDLLLASSSKSSLIKTPDMESSQFYSSSFCRSECQEKQPHQTSQKQKPFQQTEPSKELQKELIPSRKQNATLPSQSTQISPRLSSPLTGSFTFPLSPSLFEMISDEPGPFMTPTSSTEPKSINPESHQTSLDNLHKYYFQGTKSTSPSLELSRKSPLSPSLFSPSSLSPSLSDFSISRFSLQGRHRKSANSVSSNRQVSGTSSIAFATHSNFINISLITGFTQVNFSNTSLWQTLLALQRFPFPKSRFVL